MSLPGDENPNPQWQRPKEREADVDSRAPAGDRRAAAATARQQQPQSMAGAAAAAPQPQQPAPASHTPAWSASRSLEPRAISSLRRAACPLIRSIAASSSATWPSSEIGRSGGQLGGCGLALAGLIIGWIGVGFYGLSPRRGRALTDDRRAPREA